MARRLAPKSLPWASSRSACTSSAWRGLRSGRPGARGATARNACPGNRTSSNQTSARRWGLLRIIGMMESLQRRSRRSEERWDSTSTTYIHDTHTAGDVQDARSAILTPDTTKVTSKSPMYALRQAGFGGTIDRSTGGDGGG